MSSFIFGSQGDRFVADTTAHYTEPAVDWWRPLLAQPDVTIDRITFTVRRSDGALFEMTAQRRDAESNLLFWKAGTDEEFLMQELFRRANEHYEAEQKAKKEAQP